MEDYPFKVRIRDENGKIRFNEDIVFELHEQFNHYHWVITNDWKYVRFKCEQDALMFTLRWG